MRARRVVFSWCAALLILVSPLGISNSLHAAPPPTRTQRMLVGVGCYRIPAHSSAAASAYCLDKADEAPREGMMLGETAALGKATVSADGKTMSFKTALARHLIRVEGTDTPNHLSLVNTTGQTLSFCVGEPIVLMGNGLAYSGDLRRIYPQINELMRLDQPNTSNADTEGSDLHRRLQERLWQMVADADEQDFPAPRSGISPPAVDKDDCPVGGTPTGKYETRLCR